MAQKKMVVVAIRPTTQAEMDRLGWAGFAQCGLALELEDGAVLVPVHYTGVNTQAVETSSGTLPATLVQLGRTQGDQRNDDFIFECGDWCLLSTND